jgi:hypothetical protein
VIATADDKVSTLHEEVLTPTDLKSSPFLPLSRRRACSWLWRSTGLGAAFNNARATICRGTAGSAQIAERHLQQAEPRPREVAPAAGRQQDDISASGAEQAA